MKQPVSSFWEDISERLQEEHPEMKDPAKWTLQEFKSILKTGQKPLVVSYGTFRRVFKEGAKGTVNTKNAFAEYYGYESHFDYINKNLNNPIKRRARRNMLLPSFIVTLVLILMGVFFVRAVSTSQKGGEVFEQLTKEDSTAVLNVVTASISKEFEAYKSIPNYEKLLPEMKVLYYEDGAAYKAIVEVLKGQTANGWTLTNSPNPSSVNVLSPIKIDSIKNELAYLSTSEHWKLNWFDLKAQEYVYEYNVINNQQYYLRKDVNSNRWKIVINKYSSDADRFIPRYIPCKNVVISNSISEVQSHVKDAIKAGSRDTALKLMECYFGDNAPDRLYTLIGESNGLYRDVNTDVITKDEYLEKDKNLLKEILAFSNGLR